MLAKKIAVGFGIAFLLPLVVYYGVNTFQPRPNPDDYRVKDIEERYGDAGPLERAELKKQHCEAYERLKADTGLFNKYLFLVAMAVGLIVIYAGLVIKTQPIGAGLLFGGLLVFGMGYVFSWNGLLNWLKFYSVLVCLSVLMFIGGRNFRTHNIK